MKSKTIENGAAVEVFDNGAWHAGFEVVAYMDGVYCVLDTGDGRTEWMVDRANVRKQGGAR